MSTIAWEHDGLSFDISIFRFNIRDFIDCKVHFSDFGEIIRIDALRTNKMKKDDLTLFCIIVFESLKNFRVYGYNAKVSYFSVRSRIQTIYRNFEYYKNYTEIAEAFLTYEDKYTCVECRTFVPIGGTCKNHMCGMRGILKYDRCGKNLEAYTLQADLFMILCQTAQSKLRSHNEFM